MINLVRSRMIQIFSFQINLGAANLVGKIATMIDWGWTANEFLAEFVELGQKLGVDLDFLVFDVDILHYGFEGRRDKGSAICLVDAKESIGVGQQCLESVRVVEVSVVGGGRHDNM